MIDLSRLEDRHVEALVRVAKTRARAFFAHSKAMIALREEAQKRCCNTHNADVTYDHVQRHRSQP